MPVVPDKPMYPLKPTQKVKTSELVTTLLENTGEIFEQEIGHLYDGRFEPDGIQDQIKQVEAAMTQVSGDRYDDLLEVHTLLTTAAASPIQLSFDTIFHNLPWPIAILNIRAKDLALRHGLDCHEWEEDGLGTTYGFAVILPTGLWVSFHEQKHNIDRGVCNGPTIDVDAPNTDNSEELLKEVLTAFGLTNADVQMKRVGNTDEWV